MEVKMPQKPKFDAAQAQEMVDMFKDGKAIKAIARDMNTSPITVKSYLKKAGVQKRPGKKGRPKAMRAAPADKAAKSAAKPASLAQLVMQLKQTEADIAGIQQCLAQAVAKQARQLEQLKQMVKI